MADFVFVSIALTFFILCFALIHFFDSLSRDER